MAVLLSLVGAVVFGVADFLGGFATKRSPLHAVIVLGQLAGLLVLAPAALLVLTRFDWGSALWGAAAGIAGGVGLLAFYRCLATGTMSVVAPVTAVTAAAVPVLAGLALGERPSGVTVVGVLLAVIAVVLVSAEGGRLPRWSTLRHDRGVIGALLSGAAFGLFFVLLSRSAAGSGIVPVAAARVTSISLVVGLALLLRRSLRPSRPGLPIILASGVADMTANVLFLVATRQGLLVVTSVLTALYPASTVLLAQLVLHERLGRLKAGGLAVAAAAVTCIAVG
ncbi:EamA family transporter [Amnibacterium sp. CER49]|uniref:EamA family transporter n=1 Tax=Amnibacterium sp. CER49 TaxID=3039161 RepID=UPI00244810ED|nr:EamA family transporter [Amnibacterium sp. CER49]MDH2443488.1 EamA family transporter [Amnibacterium sp. CER49]